MKHDNRTAVLAWILGIICVALAAGCGGRDGGASCGGGAPAGDEVPASQPGARAL